MIFFNQAQLVLVFQFIGNRINVKTCPTEKKRNIQKDFRNICHNPLFANLCYQGIKNGMKRKQFMRTDLNLSIDMNIFGEIGVTQINQRQLYNNNFYKFVVCYNHLLCEEDKYTQQLCQHLMFCIIYGFVLINK